MNSQQSQQPPQQPPPTRTIKVPEDMIGSIDVLVNEETSNALAVRTIMQELTNTQTAHAALIQARRHQWFTQLAQKLELDKGKILSYNHDTKSIEVIIDPPKLVSTPSV